MWTNSPIIETHKSLKNLLKEFGLESVTWNVSNASEALHSEIINRPELMCEHKKNKVTNE